MAEAGKRRGEDALKIAIGASAVLALIKLVVGVTSGSMVVLASAADSFADAGMSALNRWGYRYARSPADDGHPWGHGKVEGALATGQGLLLAGIVFSLIAGAVPRLLNPQMPEVGVAVGVLVLSGAVSGGLTWLLTRAAKGERSVVLGADAAHYRVDLLTHAAGALGLVAVGLTARPALDPLIALAMAGLMAREAWGVLRGGLAELLDEALPAEELAAVLAVLATNRDAVQEFHGLRTRRSGPLAFVEVHAVLDPDMHLCDAHLLVQDVAHQIRAAVPGARVLVHPDAAGLADSVDNELESRREEP
jgi:ferrous-iron efflux pump FieF